MAHVGDQNDSQFFICGSLKVGVQGFFLFLYARNCETYHKRLTRKARSENHGFLSAISYLSTAMSPESIIDQVVDMALSKIS